MSPLVHVDRPSVTIERLERIMAAADRRRFRVLQLKVSRIEHAELCRLAMVRKGSFICFQNVPLQVVSE